MVLPEPRRPSRQSPIATRSFSIARLGNFVGSIDEKSSTPIGSSHAPSCSRLTGSTTGEMGLKTGSARTIRCPSSATAQSGEIGGPQRLQTSQPSRYRWSSYLGLMIRTRSRLGACVQSSRSSTRPGSTSPSMTSSPPGSTDPASGSMTYGTKRAGSIRDCGSGLEGRLTITSSGCSCLRTLALRRGLDPKPRILIDLSPDELRGRLAPRCGRYRAGTGVDDPRWARRLRRVRPEVDPRVWASPSACCARAELEEAGLGETERGELRRWYWCNVFMERYSSAVEIEVSQGLRRDDGSLV